MRGFRALVVNQVRGSFRDRIALIFTLGLAVLFMVIFGLLFGENSLNLSLDAVDNDHSAASQQYLHVLAAVHGVTLNQKGHAAAFTDLKNDSVAAVIVVPSGFGAALSHQGPSQQVQLYEANTTSSTATVSDDIVAQVTAGFAGGGAASISLGSPRTEQVNLVTQMDYMLPSMIAYIILFSGVNYVAIGLAEMRVRQVLRRYRATPLRSSTILVSQIVGGGLIVLLQIAVLVVLGLGVFGARNYGSWLLVIPPVILGTTAFVGIGFLISSVVKTSAAARGLAAMITFPLMFLSGIFFPMDALPKVVQTIARVLPLAWVSDALHQVMNSGAGFSAITTDCLILVAWTVVTFTLAAWRFRWE
ncbi:MAG: ABC transporter permease [Candidatus Dormibacteria bacterium]|jgi:ABC-2 type transport system permease protein